MSKNTITLAFAAGIFICLFANERQKGKLKDVMIQRLRKQNRDLVSQKIKESQIPTDIKTQIQELISQYEGLEEEICNELVSVLSLIEIGEEIKAIKDLAKIIENILKEKYQNEEPFKDKKFVPLAKLIEHAKNSKLLNPKEYNTACILKEFRNEESHRLNVSDTKNMVMVGLLGGIELILRFTRTKVLS